MGESLTSLAMPDGAVVEYSDHGSGPAVMLIHAGVFADWFVPVSTQAVLAGFQVVRIRRAGYRAGAEPGAHVSLRDHAQHAAAVAAHLGIEEMTVVAHSSGALIALELAAGWPDLVTTLVLFEPAPGGALAPAAMRDGIHELIANAESAEAAYDSFMAIACAPDHRDVVRAALGPDGLDQAIAESGWFFADETRAVGEWGFEQAHAAAIPQPTTIIVGDANPMYPDIAQTLHSWLPNATILHVSNADHLLPLRDPAEFANIIVDAAKG